MDVYLYAASLWCEDCGKDIRECLTKEGKAPENPEDESSYDSDEFPKGPYPDGGGEADTPQHCAAGGDCINYVTIDVGDHLEAVGCMLENDLTLEGVDYVRNEMKRVNYCPHCDRGDSPVVKMWVDYYKQFYDDITE